MEKLSSSNEIHDIGGQSISVVVDNNGTMELNFLDKFIEVHHYHRRSYPEYYYLRSELDWDVITSYLDFDAERPVEPTLLWPEMQVHFDIPELEEPIFAIRNELRVWDMETGETLRASSNSDSAGGVSGASPTQAQLVFDMPVSEITVWMREWDSTTQTSISLEVESGSYFIPLDGNSAHYQVDVLYEPVDGIRYEATYAFDVEYPE